MLLPLRTSWGCRAIERARRLSFALNVKFRPQIGGVDVDSRTDFGRNCHDDQSRGDYREGARHGFATIVMFLRTNGAVGDTLNPNL